MNAICKMLCVVWMVCGILAPICAMAGGETSISYQVTFANDDYAIHDVQLHVRTPNGHRIGTLYNDDRLESWQENNSSWTNRSGSFSVDFTEQGPHVIELAVEACDAGYDIREPANYTVMVIPSDGEVQTFNGMIPTQCKSVRGSGQFSRYSHPVGGFAIK